MAPAAPVGREERRALLMAAAGFFCLMCGYYTLRPMREALALEVGVQYNSILFSVVLLCSAALLPIYWWLVGRTPRGRLLWYVCTPFAAVFVALEGLPVGSVGGVEEPPGMIAFSLPQPPRTPPQ